jgi:Mn-dependent DtxR family transcriptional regulator
LPWNAACETKLEPKPAPEKHRDPLKFARYYQSLMDSGKFESQAALARYLGVSRPRVTRVLRRLN